MKKFLLVIGGMLLGLALVAQAGDTTINVIEPGPFPTKGEDGWLEYISGQLVPWFVAFMGLFSSFLVVLRALVRIIPTKTNLDPLYKILETLDRVADFLERFLGPVGKVMKNNNLGGGEHRLKTEVVPPKKKKAKDDKSAD